MLKNILFLSLFTLSLNATAQVPTVTNDAPKAKARYYRDTVVNTDPSLNGQYKFMLSRTRTSADGYKLVNPNRLTTLWKNTIDSLSKEKAEIKSISRKLKEQEKTINYLKTEIAGKDASLQENDDKVNEIKFLGIPFDKSTYHLVVWSIIGILGLGLVFIVTKSASKIAEAKHRRELYDEVSMEYQTYKAKAVEKERKLARELQDERNKIDEMKNGRI